jgi:hypothetical protein
LSLAFDIFYGVVAISNPALSHSIRAQQKDPLAVCASAGLWNPVMRFATSSHHRQPPTRFAHDDGDARDAQSKSSSVSKLPSTLFFVNAD